ncbi:MAG: hypothetical protein HN909_05645 [Phycisphaerales bacterium]|jgi:hypothetical protein|nr:hypothetical protein [Phycisphaerales bacterium]MBT7171237.1 hypothetical protein [Phycisphaerales bacterium]
MTQSAQSKRAAHRGLVVFGMVLSILLMLCAALVYLGAGGPASRGMRLDGLLGHRGFVRTACVCAGCMILLSLMGVWVVRLSRRIRAQRGVMDSQGGTVLLEFVFVMSFVLPLASLMVQASLLMGGYLSVNYASFCAARAAIVYIPVDYSDERRNLLNSYDQPGDSFKCYQVWNAAVWAVMPVGDGHEDQAESDRTGTLQSGLEDFYGTYGRSAPNWVSSRIGRKLNYAEENTSIRIEPSRSETGQYGEHEDITVYLTHDMLLNVPYAAKLMALLDDTSESIGNGRYTIRVVIPTTLPNEGADDRIDVEEFPDDDENT